MRIGVVGINHKLADLKLREQLAKACQRRFGADSLVHYAHHFVLLSTCNRTEVYFSSEDLAETHTYLLGILRQEVNEEFDQKLYSYFGCDCFVHLARVTVGLDSAVIAETEIQGQVKRAYEWAASFNLLPKELHFLFQKVLSLAKKIRTDLQLGHGLPSLEHAIFSVGRQFFADFSEVKVLFVGASEINQKILRFFKTKHLHSLTLCNRTEKTAKQFADMYRLQTLPWEQLFFRWQTYDWIIFGTKSSDYLITPHELLSYSKKRKLVVDLCLPRNVDPRLGQRPDILLWNIDQINALLENRNSTLHQNLQEAETVISSISHACILRFHQKEEAKLSLLAFTA